jgi:gliding motility-associated protein GldM
MSLPREPRQKMINMMYLVLTALLALNVSSEILNAFKTVNRSLENTNNTVNNSTVSVMASLEQKTKDPVTKTKADIWFPKATTAQNISKDLFTYIQSLKDEIVKEAGGDPNDPTKKFKEDNLDIATRILVEKGKGKELLKRLTEYRSKILTGIDPKIDSAFSKTLPIDLTIPVGRNKASKTWEGAYFHMVPTVAALTILSKFQNDVKTTENRVITFCHEQVGKVEIIFDAFEAIVGQNTNYLMPGQDLEITAGLGAFSKSKLPDVFIGGAKIGLNEKGMAVHKVPGGALGEHSVPVRVTFTDQDGKLQERTIDVKYKVGASNASIALDKMNVLYIGVDNPITVSASGGGDDKIQVSISQGSLVKTGTGKYVARVNKVDDNTIVTVTVDGKVAGASPFRVRTIPEAQAYIGGQPSGTEVSAGAFKAQPGVAAGIKNFPFQLDYDVLSFNFTCDTDEDIVSIPVQGALFQGAVKRAIDQHVKAGRMVTIEGIRVKGPDGRVTNVPSIFYYIK